MSSTVPSLFRLTSISITKRREPTRSEIPAQRYDRRSCDQRQKFELYFSATLARRLTLNSTKGANPHQARGSALPYLPTRCGKESAPE